MFLKPKDSVALQFKNGDDFLKALKILEKLEKDTPEIVPFALPPQENTLIILRKCLDHFKGLDPVQQDVGSMADPDLSEDEVTELREKYFWPRTGED